MSLPEDYLSYPHRSYGMDQDRYAWRPSDTREQLDLPNGAAVAAMVVVPLEFHMLDPTGKPFKHPGAMVTPYPDLRHYTTRDYGLRVGAFRILKELKTAGLKAVFPINAALLDRVQPLVEAIAAEGHEIAAYGLDTDHIHWGGLDRETEASWVRQVREAFDRAKLKPRVWMSPARQQSFATLDLIAKAGFDVVLDWEADEVPLPMKTTTGRVMSVPLYNELDDRTLMVDRRQSEDEWATQVLNACDYLTADADRFGGRVLSFTLTPYVAGQPFRITALRRVLGELASDKAVWSATASEIADLL